MNSEYGNKQISLRRWGKNMIMNIIINFKGLSPFLMISLLHILGSFLSHNDDCNAIALATSMRLITYESNIRKYK